MDYSRATPKNNLMDLNFYKDKKIFITGATGFIGSMLTKRLTEAGADITRVDLRRPEPWANIEKSEIIFHLAAHESGNFEPEEDLQVNALSVLYMLEACRRKQVSPKIVFASSSNLVGAPDTIPVDESFKDNPLTIFAVHKLLAEGYLKLYFQDFDIPSIILRLANVYGPSTDTALSLHSTLNKMIQNAVLGQSLKLFVNKDKIRDFLYIEDAVEAFVAAGAVSDLKGEVYIVGSEEGQSFKNIVELVAELVLKTTKQKADVILDEKTPIKPVEMRNFVADSSKFKKLTDWKAETNLKSGLEKTISYFLNVKL